MNHIRNYHSYGRKIDELRRKGHIPARRIIVTTDWNIGKLYPRIVITQKQTITNLRFEYLAALHVQIAHFDHDESILPELTNQILAIQPASIAVFNLDAVKRGEPAFRMISSQSFREAA